LVEKQPHKNLNSLLTLIILLLLLLMIRRKGQIPDVAYDREKLQTNMQSSTSQRERARFVTGKSR